MSGVVSSGLRACHLRVVVVVVTILAGAGCASIVRASVDTGGHDANSLSSGPSMSADGRYVAFWSYSSDLVPGDGNGVADVFVRDLGTSVTTRVSVDRAGGDPNSSSALPSISADGRFVAFESDASDLVPGDGNGLPDVFVRDVQAGTTVRASVDTAGGDPNDRSVDHPSISADGRYVAFGSEASDLVPGDGNNLPDVFVRDLQAGTTTRGSIDTAGGDSNGASFAPSISADGRHVAFESGASDLVVGDGNPIGNDVFVRDLQAGTTRRVSVDAGGGNANGSSVNASISATGRYVAFDSTASDLVPGDGNGTPDVYVRDVQAGTNTRVTVDIDGGDPNNITAVSGVPSISGDGRYVAFRSEASDLVPDDRNGQADVFVRDLVLNRTLRVSRSAHHGEANGESFYPSISADGRFVAFPSDASNLVSRDRNRLGDVFVKYARVVTVTGFSPHSVARAATNIPVTITGSGFEAGDTVEILQGDSVIALSDVAVVSDTRITARLSIPADAPPGVWNARVTQLVDLGVAVGYCQDCVEVT